MKFLTKENLNALIFAIILCGIGLAAYSGYQYLDYRSQIADIDEKRDSIAKEAQSIETTTQITPIAGRDIVLRRERIDLVNDQNDAVRRVGIGVALIAAGWLVWDFARSRRAKSNPTESAPTH